MQQQSCNIGLHRAISEFTTYAFCASLMQGKKYLVPSAQDIQDLHMCEKVEWRMCLSPLDRDLTKMIIFHLTASPPLVRFVHGVILDHVLRAMN